MSDVSVTFEPERVSVEALAHLGEGHIAYVKQVRSEDTPIMLTDSREAAIANAWSNELQAVSVH
jgi:hypothetical protein